MKKVALTLVMSCALLASTAVMAQDTNTQKPKTEQSKPCCSKDKKKKDCTDKTKSACPEKKTCQKQVNKK